MSNDPAKPEKITSRRRSRFHLIFFNEGQRPFLEFLRNLTPQIILLTTTLLTWTKLDFSHIDLSNWGNTAVFWLCLFFFVFAFYFNFSNFTDELIKAFPSLDKEIEELRQQGFGGFRAIWEALRLLRKHQPTIVFELLIVYAAIFAAAMSILYAASNAAKAALR